MQITKDTIGETVYLMPTGNNVRRTIPLDKQLTTATVTALARTRGEMVIHGYTIEKDFTVSKDFPDRIATGLNSGYRVYSSPREVALEQKAKRIQQKLRDKINYLSIEELLAIGEVLDLNGE